MSVTHLKAVKNFTACLEHGGQHRFEITLDEMPALEAMLGPSHSLAIPCTHTDNAVEKTVWATLVDLMADRGATCYYQRVAHHRYSVTCVIPPPGVAGSTGGRAAE
ncbi:hypothetical protein [Dyella sp.]|uniref:hypothetical protein n=1 Tax=Dyella sp. TaxID=1869338 RepID=UPI002B45EDBE|nr:hypothetical protein [Dyella sp.]HKT28754.1 hypothetical protein [Dyella sp.]